MLKSPVFSLLLIVVMAIQPACAKGDQDKTSTTINGRKFDFPIPDDRRELYALTDTAKDFLIGALNTPSPPPEIYRLFKEVGYSPDTVTFIKNYLANRPRPETDEVEALIERTRKNMIFVKGGTFQMGDFGYLTDAKRPMSDSTLDDPPHEVTLDSYSLMKNRVTYADYDIYTRAEGLEPVGTGVVEVSFRFPDYPASVTWQQARDYCLWMKAKTGKPFDLDTSAQYEYAARSGGKWLYLASTFQEESELVPDIQKFSEQMKKAANNKSADPTFGVPIGTYGSNHLGFEDMVGVTKEWVYDWFAPYTKAPQTNPRGPKDGEKKVVRLSNYSYQGTISRGRLDPKEPEGKFRCAINSTQPWK
ncbi:hypothetical protein C84B14_17578 [Salinisphaera sp. C84B14]|uniref:formylglycine-generating enzyme family protein n=1 Tax=Salinisphaera sp. C84B14 TaxID=1304155 RepID=UPI003341FE37